MAEFWWSWSDDPAQSVTLAFDWARKAVAADPQEYNAHWVLGDAYQAKGEPQQALASYQKALSLNPNDPELLQDYGAWLLPTAGRAAEGIALVEKAMRLNPRHPERYFGNLALNLYLVGRYDDAIVMVGRMSEPRFDHRLYLAASYGQLGRDGRGGGRSQKGPRGAARHDRSSAFWPPCPSSRRAIASTCARGWRSRACRPRRRAPGRPSICRRAAEPRRTR